MYNRYIPQPDGSYRRNRVPDARPSAPPRPQQPPKQESPPPQPITECPPPPPPKPRQQRKEPHSSNRREVHTDGGNVGDFLKKLLPKDFDTSDLLIIILLLLMAGDCAEDQNSAMLTLALYLFM